VIDDGGRVAGLLSSYDERAPLYREYVDHLTTVIGTLLYEARIKCHAIAGRVKARESFHGKIISGRREYAAIDEVTDVAGLRITTYFARDVDRVAAVIAPYFHVDEKNSIDRRTTIESDRFGYLSLHYIVRPRETADRPIMFEFSAFPAEIQVRSILQHAWAEIEHDLGYKYPGGIPRQIRRKFSRAAGLLEIADLQFDEIRQEVEFYERELKEGLHEPTRTIPLDIHSLRETISSDPLIRACDSDVAKLVAGELSGLFSVVRLLKMLGTIGVEDLTELRHRLERLRYRVQAFASEWFAQANSSNVVALNSGISLVFLFYDEISVNQDASRVIASLHDVGTSDRMIADLGARILGVAKALDALNRDTQY